MDPKNISPGSVMSGLRRRTILTMEGFLNMRQADCLRRRASTPQSSGRVLPVAMRDFGGGTGVG
jgi:hypothetical protein